MTKGPSACRTRLRMRPTSVGLYKRRDQKKYQVELVQHLHRTLAVLPKEERMLLLEALRSFATGIRQTVTILERNQT